MSFSLTTNSVFVGRHKFSKFPSKIQARIGPKFVNSSQIFQNRRSRCIEVRFCLSFLGEFQKLADKVGVCKSGFIYEVLAEGVVEEPYSLEKVTFSTEKVVFLLKRKMTQSCSRDLKGKQQLFSELQITSCCLIGEVCVQRIFRII